MNEDQIGKILFGLIASGVLANIFFNKQNDATPPVVTPRPWTAPVVAPPVVAPHPHGPRTVDVPPRPRDTRNAKIIPRGCLKNFDTRFGNYRMFQRSCMRENYRFVQSLPRACRVRIVTRKGARNGWDPQCLRQAGYTARRR
tara:strand:+ start:1204 stop:1629 length:426 start_codon:yes stop_codon:yes gene_type:complete